MDRDQLDTLTQSLTAFPTFNDLLHAEGYTPTLCSSPYTSAQQTDDRLRLADAYDQAQAARGDGRRAWRGLPRR